MIRLKDFICSIILSPFYCFLFLLFLPWIPRAWGQKEVFATDFSANNSSTYNTANGAIGSTGWSMRRSGNHFGARVHNGMLELSSNANPPLIGSNGWVFGYTGLAGFEAPFNQTLQNNNATITWTFNIQQPNPNPTNFNTSINYGTSLAYILACTSDNPATSGSGYMVTILNKFIRLYRFANGIHNGIELICGVAYQGEPEFTNEYYSVRVSYTPYARNSFGEPINHSWTINVRSDGLLGFQTPDNEEFLGAGGGARDSTYTNLSLNYTGGFWQTRGNSIYPNALIDNVKVKLVPQEPEYQPLSFNQNFGKGAFSVYPAAFVGWAGLSGNDITDQVAAITSKPFLNANLTARSTTFSTQPTGALYGYSTSTNGRMAIATSSSSVDGVNQPVAGVYADAGITKVLVKYDEEVLFSGQKSVGSLLLYRTVKNFSTVPNWTLLPGSEYTFAS